MARCPHCNQILPDSWLRKAGAAAMGKQGGKSKSPHKLSAANKALKVKWSGLGKPSPT